MSSPLALLHTSPVHVPTFDALRDEVAPGLELMHVVDESLLADARVRGVPAVTLAVAAAVKQCVARGAAGVLCTCSTIGAVAESVTTDVPVVRVDRPMARLAVGAPAGADAMVRIVIVAALASTAIPTRDLIREEARAAGRGVSIVEQVCPDAWPMFESGDMAGYLDRVEAQARYAAAGADVVLLAQASMAPVAERLEGLGVPVLASPRTGFEAAVGSLPPPGGLQPATA